MSWTWQQWVVLIFLAMITVIRFALIVDQRQADEARVFIARLIGVPIVALVWWALYSAGFWS